MITISLCMIVKNEEGTIERCIESAKDIADEIIIVDTGSTDKTKEAARKYTQKVYDFNWIDDFSAARNYSFQQAAMDYILWLDADDIILQEDMEKFKKLKASLSPDVDAVMMKYNTGFDRQGNVSFSYFRERLVKRTCGFKWKEPVHEYLEIKGVIINSDICITHSKKKGSEKSRNIEIYEKLLSQDNSLTPRGMYYYARELKDNNRYKDAIKWFEIFLKSGKGWVEDNISACGELGKCYQAEGKQKEALAALLQSFSYDKPRAEICCQIGYHFKSLSSYKLAAYWFNQALVSEKNDNGWGFVQNSCRGFIPCIECAVCYDNMGEHNKAALYNDMAALFNPESPAVLHNKAYFEKILHGKDCE